jgi:membrane peptidoglycan carboxypeptidase
MASLRPTSVAGALRRLLLLVGVSGLCGVLIAGIALPFAASVGLAARSGADAFLDLEDDLDIQPQPQRSRIVDESGRLVATFYEQNRVYVGLDAIAPVMKDAILAIEDTRFYEHGPIDLQGTARAFVRNFQSGEVSQGGSTLTQQYVKLVLVEQASTDEERRAATETSYTRKLRELRLAVAAEKQLTKDEILERYLNIAYFGSGAYGVEAAAQHYFSTTASELTLTQAALLAGLVQLPSAYDPETNPETSIGRRNTVLTRMADLGIITQAEAAEARQTDLGLAINRTSNGCSSSYAPSFCDYVYRELLTIPALGETADERDRALRRGGLTVQITLSKSTQDAAQQAVSDYVAPSDPAVGAIAMVEPGTGKVRALAHSRGYGEGEGRSYINYTVDTARGGGLGFQPGSTFKVFVLAAAIQQGIPLNQTINAPQTINMSGKKFETCQGTVSDPDWQPKNSTGSGTFDLRTGTWRSINTFFIQLSQQTGLCDPWKIADGAGLTSSSGEPLEQVPSFTLGVNNVSPLAMAEGYATFAARGKHCDSYAVAAITDRDGEPVELPARECNQVVEEGVADGVNEVLRGVIDGPDGGRTGARMSLGRPAAGKTGTTNQSLSVWFAGYTPQLAAAAVVADADPPLRSLDGIRLNGTYYRSACGGCIPGPIWRQAMSGALDGAEALDFVRPDPRVVRGTSSGVPDVRGQSVPGATQTLESAGFRVDVGGETASRLDPGQVVFTEPRAGVQAPSGALVRLYLSNGRSPQSSDETSRSGSGRDSGDGGGDDSDSGDGGGDDSDSGGRPGGGNGPPGGGGPPGQDRDDD